jgi:hypothetical protein
MPESLKWEVYLDGELLEDCIEASDESGIAFVLDLDAEGRVQWGHGLVCTREEYTVTLVFKDPAKGVISTTTAPRVLTSCDCPVKTRMLRGRVEFRRRMRTRHEWVSPSKENN